MMIVDRFERAQLDRFAALFVGFVGHLVTLCLFVLGQIRVRVVKRLARLELHNARISHLIRIVRRAVYLVDAGFHVRAGAGSHRGIFAGLGGRLVVQMSEQIRDVAVIAHGNRGWPQLDRTANTTTNTTARRQKSMLVIVVAQ